MIRRLPVVISLALAATLLAAAPASARTGRCLGNGTGPTCHFWTGKVTSINDGDTVDVDLDGDRKHRSYHVRFTGVQAMEQTVYSFEHPERRRGQCHAVEATARVEQLIRASHWRVRLSAMNPAARAGDRLKRWIAVRIGGRWQDLGERLMAEGHTLWMPPVDEWAWNNRYNRAGQEAALRHVGLWNPTHCGVGPDEGVRLRLWVSWNPPGIDRFDINGEWIKVQNTSAHSAVSLGRWWVRDSMLRRFTFPRGVVLGPGATTTVYAGRGPSEGLSFHWRLDVAPFQNIGDGGYLFDPKGDLRAHMVYPCVVSCSDPNEGAIAMTAHPRDEYVTFRNVSSHPVDLYGYEMALHGSRYDFGPASVLEPNQTLEVDTEGDPADDTAFRRYWGLDGPMLPNHGGSVRLSTFNDITVACDAWGDESC